MRTSRATISLKANKSKMDGSGYCPVQVVVCFHGRVCRNTGIKVLLKLWDVRKECVKASHPNAVSLNKLLKEKKADIESMRDTLELRGGYYTAEDVFGLVEADSEAVDVSANRFGVLLENYLQYAHVCAGTEKSYRYAGGLFVKHFGDIDCGLLELGQMVEFARFLSDDVGLAGGSVTRVMTSVYTVLRYADRCGTLSNLDWLERYDFKKVYGVSKRYYCLEEGVVRKVFEAAGDMVAGMDVSRIWGVPGSLSMFCSLWILNGIAPVDLSCLRDDNVKEVEVDGVKYWKVEYKRQKTRKEAKAMLRKDDEKVRLYFGRFVEDCVSRGGGYIFPVLKEGLDYDARMARVSHVFGRLRGHFLGWAEDAKLGVDRKEFSYYTVRHTFASTYANRPGASLRRLATLMARSVTGLDTYIHQLNEESDLVEAGDVIRL